MIDLALVERDPERVRKSLERRHHDDALLSSLAALSVRRRELVTERDNLNAQRNTLSQQIGGLMRQAKADPAKAAEADALKATVHAGNERIGVLEAELATVDAERDALAMGLPNLLDDRVPPGKGDADNVEVRAWGTPRPQGGDSHVEIGTRLGILDLERATKLAGARFWVLTGLGARLERAITNYFLDLHTGEHGYTEVLVPCIVHRHIAEGTGQLPKFEQEMFKLEGKLNGEDAFLIPTAEVPVTNLHRDEILDAAQLPIRYAGATPCFRSEAGSAGRDVRGLIRVHQFHKVELVWIVNPDHAEEAHQQLVGHAERALQGLGLPYRVMELCGGDVGFGAARCFDLEVWLPSQGYREISSCSWFGDFQARRMGLRFRPADPPGGPRDGKKQKPRFAHTLNGSGLAVGRTLVAVLENCVEPDGSLLVPEALRRYLGTDRIPARG